MNDDAKNKDVDLNSELLDEDFELSGEVDDLPV